jgi:hypothetical protein
MSGRHTPGPWFVDGPPNNQIVWSDEENRVCFMAHSNGKDVDRDIATGRLIAAAPELLVPAPDAADILEHYADYIRSLPAAEFDRHPYLPHIEDVAADLRAAIAKATGAA